ncbi:MAG TPA: AAA family ATPase [Clostridia bacterium]
MKIISIFNQKGGVAKTTTAVNLGAAFANMGKKTLIVDLDAQANASTYLGFKKDKLLESNSIYECLQEELPLSQAISETEYENLYIVPSNKKMASIEQILTTVPGRETLLKESIQSCENELDFDYILLDFPPALGIVSLNGLIASKYVIVPVEGVFALEGVNELLNTIRLVKRKFNPDLDLMGALLTKYTNTNLSNNVYAELAECFGDKVFKNVIRSNVKIGESQAVAKPILYFDSKSAGSEDYMALAKEVIEYGN